MEKNISIIFIICVFTFKIGGKEIDHWGTHFIMSFMDTLNNPDARNILVITSREPTQVKVIFHQTNHRIFYDLPTNGIQRVEFPRLSIAVPFGIVLKDKAISVEASAKVSVYAYSYLNKTSDGFLVLPVASLGLEYITVTLGNFHTSGTRISASKPVAVIVASESVGLSNFHSEIVEMLPPINNFGTVFSLLPPHGHNGDAMLKIVATQQWHTVIELTNYGALAGQFKTVSIKQGDKICFTTTNPVLVVLFMTGRPNALNPRGNSFMIVIPPVNKYSTDYVIPTNILNAYDNSYVNQVDVIAKLPFSVPMNPGLSYYLLCGDYSYNSSVNVLNDVIHYKGEPAFLVLMYGYTYGDGYGFPAGMALTDYTSADECSSSPCHNGGWCIETAVSYECYCHNSRYEGDLCEIDTVNDCHDNPCINGICTDYSGYYICDCDAGYTDYNCSTFLLTTTTPEPSTPPSTTSEPATPEPTIPWTTTPETTTSEPTTTESTIPEPTTPETTTIETTTQEPTTPETTTPDPTTTSEPTTTESITPEPTTLETTTPEPTTPETTTPDPTTTEPTTQESTTPEPTTPQPTTSKTTTPEPTTPETTTPDPTTTEPTTQESTTPEPTTPQPTTSKTTTPEPTTPETTTPEPTSPQPTTTESTTPEPTTPETTTTESTTPQPTTPEPTTPKPTTAEPMTPEPPTPQPTTTESITLQPTTTETITTDPTTPETTTTEPTTTESTIQDPTTPQPTKRESTTPEQTTPEPTTPEPTTTESTIPDPTTLEPITQEPTTPQPTTREFTAPHPTTKESTTLEPTTPQPTTPQTTPPKPTTPKTTTPQPTTPELTTQKPTRPDSTTQDVTTQKSPEPTTPELTTRESTTAESAEPTTQESATKSKLKTPEPTSPTQSDLTTIMTTPLNKIEAKKRYCNGNLCMCRCPCAATFTKSQIQNYTLQQQNQLSVEKKILSKTFRKKISAKNLTQSESNLGISSTVFVTSVICVIVFMDISKMYVWLLSKYQEYKWRQLHVRPL